MKGVQHQIQFFMDYGGRHCETEAAQLELIGAKQLRGVARRIAVPAGRKIFDRQFNNTGFRVIELCIVHFNRHEFFEAHETWEDAWHMAWGIKHEFYQGMIQCAVALEHYRRSNPRGV